MNAEDYLRHILQARTREERRTRLAQVPFHLRDEVHGWTNVAIDRKP